MAPAAPAAPTAPAPPTAPAAPAVAAAPTPPAAPTDPVAVQLLNVLTQICPSATTGGNLEQLARAAGYRRNRDVYVLRQPTFQISVRMIDPRTCEATAEYPAAAAGAPDAINPTIVALHEWATANGYTLRDPFRNESDLRRDIRSWLGPSSAILLVTEKRLDGTPVLRNRDRSRLTLQRSPS